MSLRVRLGSRRLTGLFALWVGFVMALSACGPLGAAVASAQTTATDVTISMLRDSYPAPGYGYDFGPSYTTPSANARADAMHGERRSGSGSRSSASAIWLSLATKGGGRLGELRRRLADETGSIGPGTGRGAASRLTNSQATDLAEWQGFASTGQRLRGQQIFRQGRRYIVQDIDGHSGGVWKMATSPKALGSKSTRMGTYDEQLNRLGP